MSMNDSRRLCLPRPVPHPDHWMNNDSMFAIVGGLRVCVGGSCSQQHHSFDKAHFNLTQYEPLLKAKGKALAEAQLVSETADKFLQTKKEALAAAEAAGSRQSGGSLDDDVRKLNEEVMHAVSVRRGFLGVRLECLCVC